MVTQKDSIFSGIDSVCIQRSDGTHEPLDASKSEKTYSLPKDVETFSFSLDGKMDKKTQKRFKHLLFSKKKPLSIEWSTIPFFHRIKLWFIVTRARHRHYPILIENADSTRAIYFKDINDAL